VGANQPINSLDDLTEHLKKKKGGGFYSTGANTGIVSAELYARAIGVELQRVTFRSPADMVNELINGNIDFTFTDASWVAGQVEGGRIRALAIAAPKRSDALPTVPTLSEAGVPGVEVVAWWAVAVPAETPQPVIDKLASYFNRIMDLPETKEFLKKFALDPFPGDAAFMRQLLVRDIERWGEYARLAKIEPQ